MRRARLAVPAVLFATAVGCGRGCGCVEGEKTYETLDGKVKVELVRRVVWTGGRVPGPVTKFYVRVHTGPPFSHEVGCAYVDLAEDEEGRYVAYRCRGEEADRGWKVLRLRGGDAYLFDCEPPVGAGASPVFADVDPVAKAADRLAGCILKGAPSPPASQQLPVLVRAIVEDAGPDEAAAFVARLASEEIPPAVDVRDPWDRAFGALPEPARSRLASELCPTVSDADAPPRRWVRAVRSCPLDGEGVARSARRRFVATLRDEGAYQAIADDSTSIDAFHWAALLTTTADDACEALPTLRHDDPRIPIVIDLIARTRTRCTGDVSAELGVPCGSSIACDGGLCAADRVHEIVSGVAAGARALDGGLRAPALSSPDPIVARLSALYAQGPLPKEVSARNARLTYEVWPAEGKSCADEIPTGSPCVCSSFDSLLGCELPLDGGTLDHWDCVLRADDSKKRIEVTRACGGLYRGCAIVSCCPGHRCEEDDAGRKSCVLDD